MTYYQALKSLQPEQASALIYGGLLKPYHIRDIQVFEYYEEQVKAMPRMYARTQTADAFHISEESVSVIVRRMRIEVKNNAAPPTAGLQSI